MLTVYICRVRKTELWKLPLCSGCFPEIPNVGFYCYFHLLIVLKIHRRIGVREKRGAVFAQLCYPSQKRRFDLCEYFQTSSPLWTKNSTEDREYDGVLLYQGIARKWWLIDEHLGAKDINAMTRRRHYNRSAWHDWEGSAKYTNLNKTALEAWSHRRTTPRLSLDHPYASNERSQGINHKATQIWLNQ